MTFIALDLGTTFIKGALLDLDHLQMSQIRRLPFPGPLAGLPTLFHEVDPLLVVATVRRLIEELLELTESCAGIVFCTQMHGLVLCSEHGEPRSNMITWQDQRVLTTHPSGQESYFGRLKRLISAQEQQQLGNELQPSRPLCYLYWMAENGKLPSESVYPAALTDFVIANLCHSEPSPEPTNAGAHCALNLTTMEWHTDVLQRLGLAQLHWSPIRPFGAAVGQLRLHGQEIPCYAAVGDHQCALVGAFLSEHQLSLNISTGSQVTTLTSDLALGNYQTRPFFDGRFINTITGVPAGRSLNALVNLLSELAVAQGVAITDPWQTIADAVSQVEKSEVQVNLAFYDSLLGRQGHILNLREENMTVGHLFRAAFENMAENYYVSAERLIPTNLDKENVTKHWEEIIFSGGLAQKFASLRTIIQHKFQMHYRLCASGEDTLLGLLALALVASGRKPTVAAAIEFVRQNYHEEGEK